jgi:predicted  nucleic acid-binding Zn-ribbon protein
MEPERSAGEDQGTEFRVALDAIRRRIRLASHTDWTAADVPASEPDASEDALRLAELEREERELSKRRRELHARIDLLEAAPAPLSLTFAAQLDAYKRAEYIASRDRRKLHREIDRLADALRTA